MIQLPIIHNVTGYLNSERLTTIFFECNMYDERGLLSRSFEVNNYELHWFYKALGWDEAYTPFNRFWENATENDKTTFLFIMITREDSVVSMSAKAKVRNEIGKIIAA